MTRAIKKKSFKEIFDELEFGINRNQMDIHVMDQRLELLENRILPQNKQAANPLFPAQIILIVLELSGRKQMTDQCKKDTIEKLNSYLSNNQEED